jgi:BirA family biotin operon repressor/biotin-[acetyl-CoA-carboxylase] ligase
MDQASLEAVLAGLPVKEIHYSERLGSTNDAAALWIEQGAPDLALVVADEQTAGKGRLGRKWHTWPGAALAFSLILHIQKDLETVLPRWSALGALAVCEALEETYAFQPEIKWPNDVLLDRRKAAGILAETVWSGDQPAGLILGIGINIAPASISEAALPKSSLFLPAACLDEFLPCPVDRLRLLRLILEQVIAWRPRLASPELINAWEARLAFRGEWVRVFPGEAPSQTGLPLQTESTPPPVLEGKIVGLASDGALRLQTLAGDETQVRVGDVRLRPV